MRLLSALFDVFHIDANGDTFDMVWNNVKQAVFVRVRCVFVHFVRCVFAVYVCVFCIYLYIVCANYKHTRGVV